MVLPLLFVALAGAVQPEFVPVLRIGAIDGSCADLKVVPLDATIRTYAAGAPIEPAQWPAIQPGALDRWAGSLPCTYRFVLPRPNGGGGTGTYRLRIGFLGAHPYSPPALRVQVGEGVWADHTLPPGRQYIPRDNIIQETRPDVLEMDIPEASLPAFGPVTVSISQTRPSSWVYYDGIEVLYSDRAAPAEIADVSLKAMPLIRASDGEQVVHLHARCRGVPAPLSLRLDLPGGPEVRELGAGGPAVLNGDFDAEVHVGPVAAPRRVEAELSAGGGAARARAALAQRPVRHFELFVVPEAHFDNGYTHPQEECVDRAVTNLRAALDLAGRFENFSWTSESAYIVQRWWEHAPRDERDRFVALTRAGRMGLDAAYCNILSGLCTGEELQRLFTFAGAFADAHRLDLRTASLTDVPSHTWSLPQVLAHSGIEFLSIGGNPTRGGFWKLGRDLFWKPVLWEGPDGSRIFTLIHRHYAHATIVGLTGSLEEAERGIPAWIEPYDTPEYPYDIIHLHGAYWDNALVDARLPETVKAWNDKYRWPRVRLATNAEFLEHLRAESGPDLPVVRGDGGAYWEDGAASSAAFTAINRDNARRLSLVETVLAAQHARGQIAEYPAEELRAAWENILLYDEHTWGAAWSITRPDDPGATAQFERKARFATDAQRQIAELMALGAAQEPGLAAPERAPAADPVTTHEQTITSPFYRVSLDGATGLVRSITDLSTGRELVEGAAPGVPGFGQLVYETKPRHNPPDSDDLAVGSERSFPEPVSIEPVPGGLRSRFRHAMFPRLDMTVLLDGASARLEIRYDLQKKATTACEGVYFAFPFALKTPRIDYLNAGAVVRAGADWLPHACLDWFTTESLVRLVDPSDGFGVVWSSPDAPLFELQDITTHRGLGSLPIENGRLFSYVMNNYWETNYKAGQDGEFRFRYTISSAPGLTLPRALDAASPWSPAVAGALDAIAAAEPAAVRVRAFKRAEDGDGYIVRLWNSGDAGTPATLRIGALPGGIAGAEAVSGVEAPLAPGAGTGVDLSAGRISLRLKAHETVTLRVRPKR